MAHSTNPAGRFLQIITAVDMEKLANVPASKGWSAIIQMEPSSGLFLPRLASVLQLPWQIEGKMRQIAGMNHDAYLSWIGPVKTAFSQINLMSSFSPYAIAMGKNTKDMLAICDDQLHRLRPEPIIDEDKLVDIEKQIIQLLKEVQADNEIESIVKDFIIRHLQMAEQALHDYRIQGIEVIRAAAERAIGSTVIHHSEFEKVKHSKHGEPFTLLWATFIVTCVTAYSPVKEIGRDIMKHLPAIAIAHDAASK